eukprot:6737856-Lingulodinium_polyedra.AAC.1
MQLLGRLPPHRRVGQGHIACHVRRSAGTHPAGPSVPPPHMVRLGAASAVGDAAALGPLPPGSSAGGR